MKKKTELSLLNVFFCALVILIHVLSAPVTQLEKQSVQYALVFFPWRLSAFVVQGFIFLAGLKMALGFSKPVKYGKYIKSRFTSVLVPYVVWVVAFYIYFISRNYFDFSLADLVLYILKGDLVSHFYFVITIVQFYALRPFWKLMTEKVKFPISIVITAVIMLLSKTYLTKVFGIYMDRIFTTYLIFWVCGIYVGANYERVKEKILKNIKTIFAVCLAVLVAQAVSSYVHFTKSYVPHIQSIHFVYCLCAILFCFSISLCFSEKVMKSKFLQWIDAASYYIYLSHPLFIFLINEKIAEWAVVDIGTALVIRALGTYTVSIALCVLYAKLKGKVKSALKNAKMGS